MAIGTRGAVTTDIAQFLPATLELVLVAGLLMIAIGLPLGVWSARFRGRAADHLIRLFSLLGVSAPSFVWAVILMLLFAYFLPLFPIAGRITDSFDIHRVTGFLLVDTLLAGNLQAFADALWRLLQLVDNAADAAVLGSGRLREVYYAVLKGEAGAAARGAFGAGREIARAIEYLSAHLSGSLTIEGLAAQAGMSRAVFHRKFKQTTTMSPIQFMKSMRLNKAAMKIAAGSTVNKAAMEVGYVSSSQFSREFKRMYGQSPKQWRNFKQLPAELT